MEEVDQTLLSILRSISVPLPESVTSLSALTTDLLVLSVSHALALARPGLAPLPKALPKGNAARFRVCSQLGEAIKNAGYGGESGYQVRACAVAPRRRPNPAPEPKPCKPNPYHHRPPLPPNNSRSSTQSTRM